MNQQAEHYSAEPNAVDYIKVIYKYLKLIIALVLVAMFSTAFFSLLKPKMYEAFATFFPLNTSSNIQAEGIIIKPGLDIEDLIMSILQSRNMADMIIKQLKLKDVWDVDSLFATRDVLQGATKLSLEQNGIIKLSVQTKTPELSVKIANAYVDNLDYFNQQLNIGAQRNIVQVIDRAVVPDKRMPRGTVKNTFLAGFTAFILAILWAFFLEFLQIPDLKKRLTEK